MTSDLQTESKRQSPLIHREDSILSKGSLSSLFKKSFDSSWSSGPSGTYIPKPEKTFAFIETILVTLSDMYTKYSKMTCQEECGIEHQDYNEICLKLDDRMLLIQNLRSFYMSLTESRQAEFDKIESKIRSILSSKTSKKSFDIEDNEAYLSICRELLVVESKLERCSGKLQFQIMELDFIGKISPLDQYELSIRLNETTKFKTRIKIERNGYQVWDSRNFSINPMIDDYMYIKFSELKPLNKSTVLTEKKLPFINNLIKAEPNIFTLWLSPVGTIKLKVIVQWNATLEDPGLNACLAGLESRLLDNSIKNDTAVHIRSATTSHKYANAHLSSNVDMLFRSHRVMDNGRSSSMSNIVEDVEVEKSTKKVSTGIQHGNIINETINEAVNVTPDLAEPQEHPNIKIDIVDENERKIPDERTNRKIILRNERVFVNLVTESESCLDQEIDTNCTKDQDTIKNIMSTQDTPPAHIQDNMGDCEIIVSPIIVIHEASIVPEDGDHEKPLEIFETQTSNYVDKSISLEDPDVVAGEAICEMGVNLLVEEEEDSVLISESNVDHSLNISGRIAENIGEPHVNDVTGTGEKESQDINVTIDNVEPHVCIAAIINNENSNSKIDLDNRGTRSPDVVIDSMESEICSVVIDRTEESDSQVGLDSVELRNPSSAIDDETSEYSEVIHNTEPATTGNIEANDPCGLITDIPIPDKCDNLESIDELRE